MVYCRNCGRQIDDRASYCPSCGAAQGANNNYGPYDPSQIQPYQSPQYQQQYQRYPPQNPNDSGSVGWFILAFFLPFIGFILWLVWINDKPKCSRMAGLGTIISIIIGMLFLFLPDFYYSSETILLLFNLF